MPRTLSIKVILIIGFGGLLAAGIGASLFVGLTTAFQNTRDLLSENAEGLVERIAEEVEIRLSPIERQARTIADLSRAGTLNLRQPSSVETKSYFSAILSAMPQIAAIGIVNTEGFVSGQLQGGVPLPVADYSDQPSALEWVDSGRADPPPQWGPPFWQRELDDAVIVYEQALFDGAGYVGMLAIIVRISDFSRNLAEISETSFVLYGKDDVLAHPLLIGWRPFADQTLPDVSAIYDGRSALMPLANLGDPVLERLWTAENQHLVLLQGMRETQSVASKVGDVSYVYMYRALEGYGPKTLYVGTYVNAHQEGETVTRLFYAMIAGGVVLAIATVGSLFLSGRIGRPIQALALASRAVREGNLDDIPRFPESRITELSGAMASFSNMVEGLAERDKIRATLGRYVPERVAQQLLKDEGGLQPVEAEATILFCDVAGFTAMTERLGPVRIVEVLNAYFSAMTKVIEARGGVVTQFQGDAILAIFNVPIESADHATQAVRAAHEMQTLSTKRKFADETISCRIGVNTGNIVAGAVGAEDRLTYTVHGDAVNLAARVEALCKELKTGILVTDFTARQVDGIEFLEMGTVEIRGQSDPVKVLTLPS